MSFAEREKKSTHNTIYWDWGGDNYVLTLDFKETFDFVNRIQITQSFQVFILTEIH